MPLDKSGSKKAFSRNVSAEMHAGKPQRQALAIAYSIARKARGKAEGGPVSFDERFGNLPTAEDMSAGPDYGGMARSAISGAMDLPMTAKLNLLARRALGQKQQEDYPSPGEVGTQAAFNAVPYGLGRAISVAPKATAAGLGLAGAIGFPNAVGAEGINVEPTSQEQSEISRIRKMMDAARSNIQKGNRPQSNALALKGLQDELDRAMAPIKSRQEAALKLQTEAADRKARDEETLKGRQTESQLPYAVKHPDRQAWMQENMPAISMATGAALGLLGKGKIVKPVLGGLGAGGVEGAVTAAWPTLQDIEFLPKGDNWQRAVDQFSDPDFWKRTGAGMATHAGLAGATALAGSKGREVLSQISDVAKRGISYLRGAPAAAEEASTLPARMRPKVEPVNTTVGGVEYRRNPNGYWFRKDGNNWRFTKKPEGYAGGGGVDSFDDRFLFPDESAISPRTISKWPVLPHAPYAVPPRAEFPEPSAPRDSFDDRFSFTHDKPVQADKEDSGVSPWWMLPAAGVGATAAHILHRRFGVPPQVTRGLIMEDVVREGGRFKSVNPFRPSTTMSRTQKMETLRKMGYPNFVTGLAEGGVAPMAAIPEWLLRLVRSAGPKARTTVHGADEGALSINSGLQRGDLGILGDQARTSVATPGFMRPGDFRAAPGAAFKSANDKLAPSAYERALGSQMLRSRMRSVPPEGMAGGGTAGIGVPYYQASAMRGMVRQQGLLNSQVPGRTDKLPIRVPSGAYVVPADVVSSLGEGNTHAGGTVLDGMFNPTGGGGAGLGKFAAPRMKRSFSTRASKKTKFFQEGGEVLSNPIGIHENRPMDYGMGGVFENEKRMMAPNSPGSLMPEINKMLDSNRPILSSPYEMQASTPAASGPLQSEEPEQEGFVQDYEGETVPIIAAGGEYLLWPDALAEKYGDLDHAHKIMDAFIKAVRKREMTDLKARPGPTQ